jgi:acyl-CoA thioesterase-1
LTSRNEMTGSCTVSAYIGTGAYGSETMTIKAGRLVAALFGAVATAFAAAAAAAPVQIVALGDSLTAGYGLGPGQAFPEQLEAALQARGLDVTVTNAGVSGDTSSDGLARLDWSVPADAKVVIVELGANDALRGIDPAVTRKALSDILARLTGRSQTVLLAGMLAPRNLGDDYAKRFDAIFPDLARQYGVALYPFYLEGVATDASLNQPDGLHPTAAGVAKIVARMLPVVEKLVRTATPS